MPVGFKNEVAPRNLLLPEHKGAPIVNVRGRCILHPVVCDSIPSASAFSPSLWPLPAANEAANSAFDSRIALCLLFFSSLLRGLGSGEFLSSLCRLCFFARLTFVHLLEFTLFPLVVFAPVVAISNPAEKVERSAVGLTIPARHHHKLVTLAHSGFKLGVLFDTLNNPILPRRFDFYLLNRPCLIRQNRELTFARIAQPKVLDE